MFRNIFSIIFIMVITTTASVCYAVPIKGQVSFAFAGWVKNSGVLHVNTPSVTPGTGTEDLSSLTNVAVYDLQYSPSAPLNPLWESDNFSFAISTVAIDFETVDALTLNGQGVLSDKNGVLQDTNAFWFFSGSFGNASSFTWSTTNLSNTGVPAPAVLSIMSIGLLGICFGTKRRKAA